MFSQPVAFNCHPGVGEVEKDGATAHESALCRHLRRLLGAHVRLSVSTVRVPTFAGDAVTLAVETQRPLDVAEAAALLEKAPAVQFVRESEASLTTRASAGRDVVLAGRLRRDPSTERGLLLWLAADSVTLAAANGVKLAEARLRAN